MKNEISLILKTQYPSKVIRNLSLNQLRTLRLAIKSVRDLKSIKRKNGKIRPGTKLKKIFKNNQDQINKLCDPKIKLSKTSLRTAFLNIDAKHASRGLKKILQSHKCISEILQK